MPKPQGCSAFWRYHFFPTTEGIQAVSLDQARIFRCFKHREETSLCIQRSYIISSPREVERKARSPPLLVGWGCGSRSAGHQAAITKPAALREVLVPGWLSLLSIWDLAADEFPPNSLCHSGFLCAAIWKTSHGSGAYSMRTLLHDSFSPARWWANNSASYKNRSICILIHCSFKIKMAYFTAL